jgi:hypothetical protein
MSSKNANRTYHIKSFDISDENIPVLFICDPWHRITRVDLFVILDT